MGICRYQSWGDRLKGDIPSRDQEARTRKVEGLWILINAYIPSTAAPAAIARALTLAGRGGGEGGGGGEEHQ